MATLTLAGCGETLPESGVEVVSGSVYNDGRFTRALIDVRVRGGAAGATVAWRAGVVPEHLLCGRYMGFMLDASEQAVVVAANETRDVRLRLSSGDRPACNTAELVAACGEPVSLVLVTDDDRVLATYETIHGCQFALPRR